MDRHLNRHYLMNWETAAFADGVYVLGPDGMEVMVAGAGRLANDSPTVLVNFSADVAGREAKTGPFFSGLSIAKATNLPLIAFADPTVSNNQNVSIGWYAGNERCPDLVEAIAKTLNDFATTKNCRLILFGGSGGGFATLNVLKRLNCEASGLVLNPQTRLDRFWPGPVSKYLRLGFPGVADHVPSGLASDKRSTSAWLDAGSPADREKFNLDFTRDAFENIVQKLGIPNDTTLATPNHGDLLYLQNRSDWHVRAHAVPFMSTGKWRRVGPRSYYSPDRHTGMVFGAWGDGHYKPPRETVVAALNGLRKRKDLSLLTAELDETDPGLDASEFDIAAYRDEPVQA